MATDFDSKMNEENFHEHHLDNDIIDSMKSDLEEEKKKFLLLSADFENYKKRVLKEKENYYSSIKTNIVKNFLPVLDDLERAINNTKEKYIDIDGLKMIQSKFESTLEKMDIKKMVINLKSDEADPEKHDIITTIPTKIESEKGKIFEILENGYMEGKSVIKVAKIIVSE